MPALTLRPLMPGLVPLLPALAFGMAALPADAHPRHGGHGGQRGIAAPVPAATVSVTGHGEATVAPDLAVVSLGVTTQAKTASEAMALNAQRQSGVIEALKGLGIAPRDIQTSGLNLSPLQDYSREGQPPVITGYQAGNMVTVRVRALADLGAVLDALVAAGANEIQGVSFQREAAAEVEAEARRRAVANAAERAAVVAAAAGQRLGRVLAITDSVSAGPPQPVMMRMQSAADAGARTPIEAGELSVAADISVTWALLPDAGNGKWGGPADAMGGSDGYQTMPCPGGLMQPGPGAMPMHHGMMHGFPEGGATPCGAPIGTMPSEGPAPAPVTNPGAAAEAAAAEAAAAGTAPVIDAPAPAADGTAPAMDAPAPGETGTTEAPAPDDTAAPAIATPASGSDTATAPAITPAPTPMATPTTTPAPEAVITPAEPVVLTPTPTPVEGANPPAPTVTPSSTATPTPTPAN